MLLPDTSQALNDLASRKVTKGLQQIRVKISRDKAIETGGFRAAGLKTSGWSQMWRTLYVKLLLGATAFFLFCFRSR